MLVTVVVIALGVGALFWFALTGSPFWRPPEVAPLAPGARFSADVVLTRANGYLAAGVVGMREPDADGRCSGRFALVELGSDGAVRGAVVASGLEPDRWCAGEVEALFSDGEGGWLIAGVGRSEPEPSFEYQGERGERLTLRISADGEPQRDFGDDGILHKAVVVGRVQGVLITDELQRVTDEGRVRDDLLLNPSVGSTWTNVFAIDEQIVVAVRNSLRKLEFQTFVVDRAMAQLRYRPLRALPPSGADPDPGLSVDVGESKAPFSTSGAVLHQGRLYVLRQPYRSPGIAVEPRLIAVDPLRWQLVRSFGEDGIVPIPGLVNAPAALAIDRDGEVVVAGALNLEPLIGGLRVLRLSGDGSVDADFGGTVHRTDTDVPGAIHVVIDGRGRAVVLEASGSSVVRLTAAGKVDFLFGDSGVVDLGRVDVCRLVPARFAEACKES